MRFTLLAVALVLLVRLTVANKSKGYREELSRETLRSLYAAGMVVSPNDVGLDLTALAFAIESGRSDIVEALLKAGADPNARSPNSWTPLMHAAAKGDSKSISTLLSHGGDVTMLSSEGECAQGIALKYGHVMLSITLAENYLKAAIASYDKNIILSMIRQGAFVDTTNPAGWTALLSACSHNDIGMVRELIALGADVNHVESDGWSCVLFAAFYNYERLLLELLERGANSQTRSVQGHTPASVAAMKKHSNILSILSAFSRENIGAAAVSVSSGSTHGRHVNPMMGRIIGGVGVRPRLLKRENNASSRNNDTGNTWLDERIMGALAHEF